MSCLCLPPLPLLLPPPSPSPDTVSHSGSSVTAEVSYLRERKGCRSGRVEFRLELVVLHKLSLRVIDENLRGG